MYYLISVLAVAGFVGLAGCKKAPSDPMATLPPPRPLEGPIPIGENTAEEVSDATSITDDLKPHGTAHETAETTNGDVASRAYSIRKGDTLWSIATRVYGSGQRWQDIAAANSIHNPRKLTVGQMLILP